MPEKSVYSFVRPGRTLSDRETGSLVVSLALWRKLLDNRHKLDNASYGQLCERHNSIINE